MAISATFEIKNPNSIMHNAVSAVLFDTYTLLSMDVKLKRKLDAQGNPSSKALIDTFTVVIRGTKELKTPFYAWVNGEDNMSQLSGTINIYDSTGLVSSTVRDASGGDAPVDFGVVNDLAKEEVGDYASYGMEKASKYREGDMYDEMNRDDLEKYIRTKGFDIYVDQKDTEDIIREKIRYYNKISKMSLKELQDEVNSNSELKDKFPAKDENGNDLTYTKDDYLKALKDYNNDRKSEQYDSTGMTPLYDMGDKMKKSTANTTSSIANALITRTLESARCITFEDAYCLSLKEHYKIDPKKPGSGEDPNTWQFELTIKPTTITVTGANVLSASKYKTTIDFAANAANAANQGVGQNQVPNV